MLAKALTCSCVFVATFTPCQAGSKFSTKYNHYKVAGRSASEIVRSMDVSGPSELGVNAYAATTIDIAPIRNSASTVKSCRAAGFNYQFTINLPSHRDESGLSGKTATAWSGCSSFVKQHEETHRSIWMNCIQDFSRSAANLAATSCATFQAAAAKLWEVRRAACIAQHSSFDSSERSKLMRQPLIVLAANAN